MLCGCDQTMYNTRKEHSEQCAWWGCENLDWHITTVC
jgi:hypothetical protein